MALEGGMEPASPESAVGLTEVSRSQYRTTGWQRQERGKQLSLTGVRWSVHGVHAGPRAAGVRTLVVDQVGLVVKIRLSDCGRTPLPVGSHLALDTRRSDARARGRPHEPRPVRVSDGREIAARDGRG